MQLLYEFYARHHESMFLLALAVIAAMREELPYPFNTVALLNWIYGWLHDAMKTFLNFRLPAKSPRDQDKPDAK